MDKSNNQKSNEKDSSFQQLSNPQQGRDHRTFPARNGNAYHTLCEAQLVEMANHLAEEQPGTTSAALSLLKRSFPEASVELHLKACKAYADNLHSPN